MRIATRMSLTTNGTGFCDLRNQVEVICLRVPSDNNMKRDSSLSVEDKSYAVSVNSFNLSANVLVALWLFLVASSYFLLSKKFNVLGGCRGKHAHKVASSDRTTSNAPSELRTKCDDGYCGISDFDKTSYMHSLLSLEDEDSEWLSDLRPYRLSNENPLTSLSYKCHAYYEISDFEKGSYLHSLLSLDDEDSEWLSDSNSFRCSSENPSTSPSEYSHISSLEKASYMHSLLSLEDEDTKWLSDSKSFGRSPKEPSTPLSYKCDAYYEISDFDKASYMHSLLSLEDEDFEWLSDSKPYGCSSETPSTPINYKCDASEISDLNKSSYLHSLLSLEYEDSEWLSDSKPYGCSSHVPSTPISYKCDSFSDISDLDRASYMHSLLSFEDEDSLWLSGSKSFGCSCETPSTPISYKCDSFSDISAFDKSSYMQSLISLELDEDYDSEWLSDSKSYGCSPDASSTPHSYKFDAYYNEILDLDKASYLHSLLILEDEDSEWLSDSSSWDIVVPPSVSTSSSFGNSEDTISAEHLLGVEVEQEFSVEEEPLFLPFERKLDWNSEEPWSSFCSSPRRTRYDSGSTRTSWIKGCNDKQKGDEALCIVNYETSRLSMLGNEYFALCQELTIETLVGLKEFDGHEGLHSEFNDVFMLD